MGARPITITPVLNGFLVRVGCQHVVFQSLGYLVQEIERYYMNPEVVEKEYLETAVNKSIGNLGQPTPPVQALPEVDGSMGGSISPSTTLHVRGGTVTSRIE